MVVLRDGRCGLTTSDDTPRPPDATGVGGSSAVPATSAGPEPATRPATAPAAALLGAVDIRSIGAEIGLRPTKQRGQNFVVDANTVRRIVRVADVGPDDVVVEVGPGLGSLTLALLEQVGRVVAVEVDPVLAGLLLEGDAEGFEAGVALVGAGQEQGLVRADVSASDLVDTLYAVADGIGLRRVILAEKRPAGYRVALWEDAGRRILAP